MIKIAPNPSSAVTAEDCKKIEDFIQRPARGLLGIPVRDEQGNPVVAQISPVVEGKPFPTMYWLVGPQVYKDISEVEGKGFTKIIQQKVNSSPDLRADLASIHESYCADRVRYFNDLELSLPANMMSMITQTGVGGVKEKQYIRCLHMFYAYHLIKPHVIGRIISEGILAFKSSGSFHIQ